jgi:hypothetical protein
VEQVPDVEEARNQGVARRQVGPVGPERDAHEHDEDAGGPRTRQQARQRRHDLPRERERARDAALDVADDQGGRHGGTITATSAGAHVKRSALRTERLQVTVWLDSLMVRCQQTR